MSEICWEFVDAGECGHSDAEHDAMADGRVPNLSTTEGD